MRIRILIAAAGLLATLALAQTTPPKGAAPGFIDAMRGNVPITESTQPPRMGNWINDDQRRTRNFDAQPPTIPHRVDGYQIDRNFNKCLDCHARARTEITQAVPVGTSHYLDRDGNVLGQVSTRRYFCMQCHVAQEAVRPLIGNSFQDVDTVLRKAAAESARTQKK